MLQRNKAASPSIKASQTANNFSRKVSGFSMGRETALLFNWLSWSNSSWLIGRKTICTEMAG